MSYFSIFYDILESVICDPYNLYCTASIIPQNVRCPVTSQTLGPERGAIYSKNSIRRHS